MKIVYNTDQTYLHGGIEKVLAAKANYFANQPDTEVYVVTTEQHNYPPCYHIDSRVKQIDLDVRYNRSKSYFSKENILKAIKHYWKQKQVFAQIKPDVIISPNFNFDFYWLPFIAKGAGKIKEIHGSRYNWKPSFRNKLNAWFERKYNKVVVLNEDEASYFSTNNVVVIPNAIEKNDYQCTLENKRVLAAGRIAPVKGFDQLIAAWKNVYKLFPDWQLHIYGQDYLDTQKQLQGLISQSGLEKVVLFKGSTDDMVKTMLDYSVYAMSSVTECFPMVLLEALSVGLPIVSYDCPHGPKHIISDQQDGILTAYCNPEALATGLIELLQNEMRRKVLGKTGKLNSIRFETETVMKKWTDLLNDIKR